jgi:hypothetical protein
MGCAGMFADEITTSICRGDLSVGKSVQILQSLEPLRWRQQGSQKCWDITYCHMLQRTETQSPHRCQVVRGLVLTASHVKVMIVVSLLLRGTYRKS